MRGLPWLILCLTPLLLGMLSGCATSPPASFYALSPLAPAARSASSPASSGAPGLAPGLAIGLGPVTFPLYLDRPQLVSRVGGNRLHVDELNRWGGSVQDDFLRVWSENLALLLGTERILIFPSEIRYPLDYRIAADVLALEPTADGQALLRVRWAVLDPDLEQPLIAGVGRYQQPVAAPGDAAAQLAALSLALADFSRDLATALGSLPTLAPATPSDW